MTLQYDSWVYTEMCVQKTKTKMFIAALSVTATLANKPSLSTEEMDKCDRLLNGIYIAMKVKKLLLYTALVNLTNVMLHKRRQT